MKIAIIGLPKSGKTTIFNALTKGQATTSSYSPSLAPNIGIAKVPDSRLAALSNMFHPKKTTDAEVNYVDIAGSPKTLGSKEGLGGEFLSYLTTADALLQVIRVFEDAALPHPEGSISAKRDVDILNMELSFSDLAIIEKRIQKLKTGLRSARTSERETYQKEQTLLEKIKLSLEADVPIRGQNLEKDELKKISNYQFLTAKPMLIALNIGENQLEQRAFLTEKIISLHPEFPVAALCGKLEMELGQMEEEEATEFRKEMGTGMSAQDSIVDLSYHLLNFISFFTTGPDEVKAWTVPTGISAPEAAGKIHSDLQRGFIRAEVISYDDLMKCGNMAEARKQGLLRKEGKQYIVQDGDVITFLFNI
jgi:hypothetical protein